MDELLKDIENLSIDKDIKYIKKIISDNEYVKKSISKKHKDFNSLSYLIKKPISQSDCIKLGIGMEKCLRDIVLLYNNTLLDIKEKNKKGVKEKDHLFKDEVNKIIYYAELKSNISLDTEKSKSTVEKCLSINEELKTKHQGYEIKYCLLALRYTDKSKINDFIMKKYKKIKDNVFGINEYFEMLKLDLILTEDEYKDILNHLCDEISNS